MITKTRCARLPEEKRSPDLSTPSLLEKVQAYQFAIRLWSRHLMGAELKIAIHVLDQTLGWGKAENRFVNRDVIKSTGLADSTVRVTLKKLCEKGCLNKGHYDGRGTVYSVNLDWRSDDGNDAHAPVSDDHIDDAQRAERRASANAGRLLYSEARTIRNQDKQYSARSGPEEVGPSELSTPASRSRTPSLISYGDSMPAPPKRLPVQELERTFREEWAKTIRDKACPHWGPREYGIAKQLSKRIAKDHMTPETGRRKIGTAVRKWRWIGERQFPWMQARPFPHEPDIGFLLRFWVQIKLALDEWERGPTGKNAKDGEGFALHPEEILKTPPFIPWEEHPVTKMEERNRRLREAG